jgi:hypothetical protein
VQAARRRPQGFRLRRTAGAAAPPSAPTVAGPQRPTPRHQAAATSAAQSQARSARPQSQRRSPACSFMPYGIVIRPSGHPGMIHPTNLQIAGLAVADVTKHFTAPRGPLHSRAPPRRRAVRRPATRAGLLHRSRRAAVTGITDVAGPGLKVRSNLGRCPPHPRGRRSTRSPCSPRTGWRGRSAPGQA